MSTITKTSAQAVSRKLSSMGFDKYDRWFEVGFAVIKDGDAITVVNHGYLPGTAALELAAAGFAIAYHRTSEGAYTGKHMESFVVEGKVSA